ACNADGSSRLQDSTVTDADGTYFFAGLSDGAKYRLEFYPGNFDNALQFGFGGVDFGSNVQFVTAPDCAVNVSFAAPEDYCEANPLMVATYFVNGDPNGSNSTVKNEPIVVAFPHNSSGNTTPPFMWSLAHQAGSVYGLAYSRPKKQLFTSAFLKRHVGMGTLGLGGIYRVDMNQNPPTTHNFLDL